MPGRTMASGIAGCWITNSTADTALRATETALQGKGRRMHHVVTLPLRWTSQVLVDEGSRELDRCPHVPWVGVGVGQPTGSGSSPEKTAFIQLFMLITSDIDICVKQPADSCERHLLPKCTFQTLNWDPSRYTSPRSSLGTKQPFFHQVPKGRHLWSWKRALRPSQGPGLAVRKECWGHVY
jgi:hypothetical protein